MPAFCQHREVFENAVIIQLQEELPDRFWLVNFARQSPYFLSLAEIQWAPSPFVISPGRSAGGSPELDWHMHEFQITRV